MSKLVKWEPNKELLDLLSNAPIHMMTAQAHVVNSIATYNAVDEYLATVNADLRAIESHKEAVYRPVKDHLDAISMAFDPSIKALKSAKSMLKLKQSTWNRRQEEVAAAAQAEAKKAAEEMGVDAPEIMVATPKGRTKYRDHWVYEIRNWDQFAIVCGGDDNLRDYLAPNEQLLNARAKEQGKAKGKGKLEIDSGIPGLVFINKRIPIS